MTEPTRIAESHWKRFVRPRFFVECGVTRLYSEGLPNRGVRWPLEIVNPFLRPG